MEPPAPPTKRKRTVIACTSCRLTRSKCLHEGSPPCVKCASSDRAAECVFPERGTSLIDRAPRGLRNRKKKSDQLAPRTPLPPPVALAGESSKVWQVTSVHKLNYTYLIVSLVDRIRVVTGGGIEVARLDD
ncbi:hypothetical protein P7C70_g5310, partial [Phenoliferia sp. Uapishka_3]